MPKPFSEKAQAAWEKIHAEPKGVNRLILEKERSEDPVGIWLREHDGDFSSAPTAEAKDFSYLPSASQRAETLWALFQEAKEETGKIRHARRVSETEAGAESKAERVVKKVFTPAEKVTRYQERKKRAPSKSAEEKLAGILSDLRALYSDPETKVVYLAGVLRQKQEKEDINGAFECYQEISRQVKYAEKAVDASARALFSGRGKRASESDKLAYEQAKRRLKSLRAELLKTTATSPELAALAEYRALQEYSRELRQHNFIWTESRRELLERLEEAALSGQPVLLSGESGTGKTSLVEQASLKLTGLVCNVTPGKDVRFQDLIAKPKIGPTGETYYEYREIGEAVTGRANTLQINSENQGRIVADDEFNFLSPAEQTERLARVASWKPGKKVRLPVTNQELEVTPHFLYCAMVNLASERYERKKIPPEVLRKFAKVDVVYPPQSTDNPEIYEMMLAALMDENGRVRTSVEEISPAYEFTETEERRQGRKVTARSRRLAESSEIARPGGKKETVPTGGFLWRLANALNELNKSFSHQETVLKHKGEGQYVKDLIIDVGVILSWLKEYAIFGGGQSLEDFVKIKLEEQFLSREAYSMEDRQLVREFLKHFGIVTVASVGVGAPRRPRPEFKPLTPVEVGKLSPRVKWQEIIREEVEVGESYYIDAKGRRVEYFIKPMTVEGAGLLQPGQVIVGPEGKPYEFVGASKKDNSPILRPHKVTGAR
ncbi:MAG: AAA family ATPase [Candidatus Magasanikbacteria bacterium]|nr:AAA family ATPase [Candidatus Magasanikbacteria bacterium]